MKRIFAIVLLLVITLSACFYIFYYADEHKKKEQEVIADAKKVVVITDLPSDMFEPIKQSFYNSKKINVEVNYINTVDLKNIDPVILKKSDIIITSQENLNKLKSMRKIYKFTSEKTDTVLNIFKDKDGFWTGIWINPTIFIVNKKFVDNNPDFVYSWDEIFNHINIRLSMTDFIASDITKDLLMSMTEHFGEDGIFDRLWIANKHVIQYGKYLSTPSRMVAMDKCDIGISDYNEAKRTEKEGLPVIISYPIDGTAWYLYGIASLQENNSEESVEFINWILDSSNYKKNMEDNKNYYLYSNDMKVNSDKFGKDLIFWDLEKNYSDEGKKTLLDLWVEKIRFGRN